MEKTMQLHEENKVLEQSRHIIEEYEINPYTMVVMPLAYGSKIYSKIYELEEECISPFKPFDIIKEGCNFFGVPYEGRKDGTRKLIGATRKIPIAISPTNSIYFFPTTSPDKPQCIWVALAHVVDYKSGGKNNTIVTFKNNQSFPVPISYGSFRNQVDQAGRLRSKLSQRIEETKKKSASMNRLSTSKASENKEYYDY